MKHKLNLSKHIAALICLGFALLVAAPVASANSAFLNYAGRYAAAPSDLPAQVQIAVQAANKLEGKPYVWGGGHKFLEDRGYDCSGSVSYALHGGGLLSSPEDSTGLESFGEPGPGKYITIYADAEHAFMVIDGKRFDTVALAETGNRWSGSMTSTAGFVARHPEGL